MLSCLLLFRIELIRRETPRAKIATKMRIEKGEFTGSIYLAVYTRSLFNTIDTQFSDIAQSAKNAIIPDSL